MHNGVIRVEQVVTELGNRDVPNLICGVVCYQKSILRTVTEESGYGKCDVSDAFVRSIERVGVHWGKQREGVDEKMDFTSNGKEPTINSTSKTGIDVRPLMAI